MNKAQIGLISIGVLLVVGLFLLPKSVVNTRQKMTEMGQKTIETTEHSEDDGHDHSAPSAFHQVSLSDTEKKTLAEQQSLFEKNSQEQPKKAIWEKIKTIWEKVNRYDSIAFYAEKMAVQFPKTEFWTLAGEAYLESAKFEVEPKKRSELAQKSRIFLEKVFAEKPTEMEWKVKIGTTYVFGENPMQGIMMIREVAEKDPENRLANLQLGIFAIQSNQFQKGIDRFEALLRKDQADWESKFYLAICLLETERKAEAKKYFEEVLEQTPNQTIKAATAEYLEQLK